MDHAAEPVAQPAAPPSSGLGARIGMLAVAGGFVAANGHFSQPLLPAMAHDFGVPAAAMGVLPAVTQLGLAVGLLTVLPLYDLFERRRTIVATLVLLAIAAAVQSTSHSLAALWGTAFLVGLGCCAAQLMTPYAALLAPKGREGQASSLVLSGVLTGVLLSRVVAGLVEQTIGWRYLYAGSSLCILLIAIVLAKTGTPSMPAQRTGYRSLMRSMGALIGAMPRLRRHALNGALTMGALMAFWATYAGHLLAQFQMNPLQTGLIGLVGVAGAAGASVAGGWVDKGRYRHAQLIAALLMLAGYALLWQSHASIALFCAGVLLIDLGGGLSHAGNQSSAFALDPAARGRINSVYMVSYFLGGAVSVSISTLLFATAGWSAVCGYAAVLALLLLGMELVRPVATLPRTDG
ncbi:MFS transporter [Sphingomonas sp. HF-S4]|uniref:MFS transporter n=1 Tax=Sphingomonas agrestis TaxID=3080540 RepID=A0ABU3Y3W3_9SPHN|nr:MFS transporter [Sphingomonas sp. HF-S4]MDV3456105.1 MFS transporter [Sphingomonas sp. HF-S4]